MLLDIRPLLTAWQRELGDARAREIVGIDGTPLLQFRIEMGLLQMFPVHRPDGQPYRGRPTCLDYVRERIDAGRRVGRTHWHALRRELQQFDYRRLAWWNLARAAMRRGEPDAGKAYLRRTVRDIEHCLRIVHLLCEHGHGPEPEPGMIELLPTLLFHLTRLRTRLMVLEGWHEEAIDEATRGAEALERLVGQIISDPLAGRDHPAVRYLVRLSQRLRTHFGIEKTLREQLDEAIEREDFERAARLRDALRSRRRGRVLPQPDDD